DVTASVNPRVPTVNASLSHLRSRSGREPLDYPGVSRSAVPQSVVHPVGPAVPELHDLRRYQVTAPEVGQRYVRTVRPALLHLRVALLKLMPGRDHRRLPARPRRELRATRPGREVRFARRPAEPRHRPFDDHLAVDRIPRE